MKKPRIAFVNDTSTNNQHFGCQLVGQTFREQFARTGMDLKISLPGDIDPGVITNAIDGIDLVVVNGEGSIHHNRNRHLLDLAGKFPCVMMNCVYQDNDPHPDLAKFLYVSARESYSADAIRSQGVPCDVVPDCIFASSHLRSYRKKGATEDLGETDNVVMAFGRPGRLKRRNDVGFPVRFPTVYGYLDKLSSYNRLCIGRFHAVVAASVLEIPFCSWDSNTWKTKALMEDMGVPHLHFKSRKAALESVPEVFPQEIRDFVAASKARIEGSFDKVAAIAFKLANGS